VDFGQKRQLAKKAAVPCQNSSWDEKWYGFSRIQSLLPPRTETLEGRNPCARAARIYITTGEKSVRTRRLDRSGGGGFQVAPTKGLDPKLPRGSCRSASTRVRPIAGGRVSNVVNKFRSGAELLSFSVTASRREIQRKSPPNLTNGQETGKIFQRKMFHVLTVFFCLVRRFLLDSTPSVCATPLRSKDQITLKGVFPMQQLSKQPPFELGQIVATPGALAALKKAGQQPGEFLTRHVNRE